MKGKWKTEWDLERNEEGAMDKLRKGLKYIKAECGFGRFWASLQQLRSPAGRLKEADGRSLKYSRAPSGWRQGGALAAVALHVHSHPAFTPNTHSEATRGSDGQQCTKARECQVRGSWAQYSSVLPEMSRWGNCWSIRSSFTGCQGRKQMELIFNAGVLTLADSESISGVGYRATVSRVRRTFFLSSFLPQFFFWSHTHMNNGNATE